MWDALEGGLESTSKDGSCITTQYYLGESVGRPGGRAREVQVRMVHELQHSLSRGNCGTHWREG